MTFRWKVTFPWLDSKEFEPVTGCIQESVYPNIPLILLHWVTWYIHVGCHILMLVKIYTVNWRLSLANMQLKSCFKWISYYKIAILINLVWCFLVIKWSSMQLTSLSVSKLAETAPLSKTELSWFLTLIEIQVYF